MRRAPTEKTRDRTIATTRRFQKNGSALDYLRNRTSVFLKNRERFPRSTAAVQEIRPCFSLRRHRDPTLRILLAARSVHLAISRQLALWKA